MGSIRQHQLMRRAIRAGWNSEQRSRRKAIAENADRNAIEMEQANADREARARKRGQVASSST